MQAYRFVARDLAACRTATALVDTEEEGWPVLFGNAAWHELSGWGSAQGTSALGRDRAQGHGQGGDMGAADAGLWTRSAATLGVLGAGGSTTAGSSSTSGSDGGSVGSGSSTSGERRRGPHLSQGRLRDLLAGEVVEACWALLEGRAAAGLRFTLMHAAFGRKPLPPPPRGQQRGLTSAAWAPDEPSSAGLDGPGPLELSFRSGAPRAGCGDGVVAVVRVAARGWSGVGGRGTGAG